MENKLLHEDSASDGVKGPMRNRRMFLAAYTSASASIGRRTDETLRKRATIPFLVKTKFDEDGIGRADTFRLIQRSALQCFCACA